MNKIRFGTPLVIALVLIGFACKTQGAGQYLKIDYPAPTGSIISVNSAGLKSQPSAAASVK